MARSVIVSRVMTTKKMMALTFDDGSDGANLSAILNILSDHDIKSTFFLTGRASEAHPSKIAEIVERGHEIGNHSYNHPQFTNISVGSMESEMLKAEKTLMDISGLNPKPYFRPPYGSYNEAVLEKVGSLGYARTIMWSIDTADWNNTPADTMVRSVLDNSKTGGIVIMHTGGGTHTPEALPKIIEGLKAKGYTLTTVSTLLATARPVLRRGSTGYAVEELQRILIKLGFNPGSVDARFGPLTESAVKAYQAANILEVDGIVGPKTWTSIEAALASIPVSHSILRRGSTGDSVIYLQQLLGRLGVYQSSIDGRFGPLTEAAVKIFQGSRGLESNGIVGPSTWAEIDEVMEYTLRGSFKIQ